MSIKTITTKERSNYIENILSHENNTFLPRFIFLDNKRSLKLHKIICVASVMCVLESAQKTLLSAVQALAGKLPKREYILSSGYFFLYLRIGYSIDTQFPIERIENIFVASFTGPLHLLKEA